jgi:hypothetical protein
MGRFELPIRFKSKYYKQIVSKSKSKSCSIWLLPFENKYENIECLNKNFEYRPDSTDLTANDAFKKHCFLQVSKQGKVGLYDLEGQKWLLPIRYEEIKFLGKSLFAVSEAGKWYFVKEQGQKVSLQSYDYIGEKNSSMDCGNPETYWQRVKGRFYVRPEGLLMFLSRYDFWEDENPIPILLTWAELKPFLKH